MLIDAQRHMERTLYVGGGGADVEHKPIRVDRREVELAGSREGYHGCIISFERAELVAELFRRQIVEVIPAGRIIEFAQQLLQSARLPQRQRDSQRQALISRRLAPRSEVC